MCTDCATQQCRSWSWPSGEQLQDGGWPARAGRLLGSLTRNVPKDVRADYYVNTRRARIAEIRTWGKLPFEFAHFTDAKLAGAILAVARTPPPRGRGQLLNDLRNQRGRPAPDVSKIYRWHQSGLSKPILADTLWPKGPCRLNAVYQADPAA
jgi:hypothetical protein